RATPDRPIHLSILVPIFDERDGSRPLGVLVLRIDPATHLYPDISRWPTPSRTAETLLVRRDGNDALFLNDLRFRKNAALNLRVSLEEGKDLPVVKAAMGEEGIVEGTDYRGEPVIAAVRAVPDSPWFLVGRMDAAEVYAPVREQLWVTAVAVGVLVLGTGAGIGLVWRQQSVRFYRERSRVADALRESEEDLSITLHSIGDAVIATDTAGRVVRMNPAAERLTGWPLAETVGKPLAEIFRIINVLTREPASDPLAKALATGEVVVLTNDTALIARDGAERQIADSAAPIRDAQGRIRGAVLVFHDVTAQYAVKKALRESEERYRSLYATSQDAIIIASPDKCFLAGNPAAIGLFGCRDEEDFTRRTLADLSPERQPDGVPSSDKAQEMMGLALEKGSHFFEWTHKRVDGTEFPATVLLSKFEAGGTRILQATVRDITVSKRAEEALQQANTRLEELATTDDLTGLANRRGFMAAIGLETERARRYGSDLALAMIDVDGFKAINDVCGHVFGDRVLVEVARAIEEGARAADLVARYGGDEIIVLMPNTDAREAVSAVERIRRSIAGRVISDGQRSLQVAISAGVSALDSKDRTAGPDLLIRQADEALYAAKHAGGNVAKTWNEITEDRAGEIPDEAAGVEDLQRKVAGLSLQAKEMVVQSLWGLVHALEARDSYTKAHSANVTRYAVAIAETLELDPEETGVIRRAAMVHDIGKIAVPDSILRKRGALDDHERRIMQGHVLAGVKIIDQMRFLDREVPLVRHHHEWWKGEGYPDGIAGEAIPLGARILAVADAFDAITSNRVYRNARSVSDALRILVEESGRQFAPGVVDAMVKWVLATGRELGKESDLVVADLLETPAVSVPV
ncbi:MAG: diguanylate cyclase, partial [Planctomycetota bacterium]|nr:diguanylate cyclase [Planctomycetota bacterium]